MTSTVASMEANIKRDVTKWYKSALGKGPDNTTIRICENILIAKFEGAFTTLEESVYYAERGNEIICNIRETLFSHSRKELEEILAQYFSCPTERFSYSINMEKNQLYLFMIFQENIV